MNFNKLAKISVFDLTAICRSHMHLSRLDCQTRVNLHSAIRNQPISVQEAIEVDVDLAIQKGLVEFGREIMLKKIRDTANGNGCIKKKIQLKNTVFFFLSFFSFRFNRKV